MRRDTRRKKNVWLPFVLFHFAIRTEAEEKKTKSKTPKHIINVLENANELISLFNIEPEWQTHYTHTHSK